MYVTYTPEGNEPQTWEFDPNRVRVSEMVIVEKQYGGTWAEFLVGVMGGEAAARQVLLWHLIRRDGHVLSFRDAPDFFGSEIVIERSLAEITRTHDEWVKAGGPGEENGFLLGSMFEAEMAAAREKFGDGAGKAPSKNAPGPTPGP